MAKDKRYRTIKILIEGNHLQQFKQIFDHIPKTIVGKDMGIHFRRFNRMVANVAEMKIKDMHQLADFFNVDPRQLYTLVHDQVTIVKETRKALKNIKDE